MHFMYVIWLLKVISIIKTSLNLFKIKSFSLDKLIYIKMHQSKIIITFFQSVNKLWMQFKYPTRYRPYNMKGLQYSCIQVIGKKQEPPIYHDWKPKENLGSRWRVHVPYVTQKKLPECQISEISPLILTICFWVLRHDRFCFNGLTKSKNG